MKPARKHLRGPRACAAPEVVVLALGPRPVARVAGLDLCDRAMRAARAAGATRVVLLTDQPAPAQVRGQVVRGEREALEDWLRGRRLPVVIGCSDAVVDRATLRAAMDGPAGLLGHGGASAGWCRLDRPLAPGDLRRICHPAARPTRVVDGWHVWVDGPAGRRAAEDRLFEACRKSVDGVVARTLNRPVSLRISRRAVDGAWSPDRWTALTFAVALGACATASLGGYGPTLLGALLMHVASVLDGVDGELARVRFETSSRGAWLDTLSDDVSNVLFWAALAVGASRGDGAFAGWWALAGWVAAGANLAASTIGWWLLGRRQSGDWYDLAAFDPPHPGRLRRLFEVLLKQDFFLLLCVVLAFFDALHAALPVMAAAALLAFANAVFRAARALGGAAVDGARAQPNTR